MSRATIINERLAAHCHQVGVIPQPLDRNVWPPGEDPLGYWRFGWQPPEFFAAAGKFHLPYCPAIIDEQTAHLSDVDLIEYLRGLEFMQDKHVTLASENENERSRQINELLYEIGPGTLALMNDVHVKALERNEHA